MGVHFSPGACSNAPSPTLCLLWEAPMFLSRRARLRSPHRLVALAGALALPLGLLLLAASALPGCGTDADLSGGVPDSGPFADLIEPEPRCGDGVVNGKEDCDNGTNMPGSGCEPECKFT